MIVVPLKTVTAVPQEMMQVISAEPGVMCIVGRRRSEKGYRNLQGERARDLLTSLITSEVRDHDIVYVQILF